jgi:hypothetical protein
MDVREVSALDVELNVSAAGVSQRGSLGCLWSVQPVRPERRFPAFSWSRELVRLVLVGDLRWACGI